MTRLQQGIAAVWNWAGGKRRFPYYQQITQSDCGVTCLRMIASHYGTDISAERLRSLCPTSRSGLSLLALQDGAEAIGFQARPVSVPHEQLRILPTPFIAHWRDSHFVVVHHVSSSHVWVADPGAGRARVSHDAFGDAWTGLTGESDRGAALLLEPGVGALIENTAQKDSRTLTWPSIARLVMDDRQLLLHLSVAIALMLSLSIAGPVLTRALVDTGLGAVDLGIVHLILLLQLAVFAGALVARFTQSWMLLYLGQRLNISLLARTLARLLRLPMSYFSARSVGDVLQRVHDHDRLDHFITTALPGFLLSVAMALASFALLLLYSVAAFWVLVATATASAVWGVLFLRRLRRLDERRFSETSDSQDKLVEMVDGIGEIKAHNAETQKQHQWEAVQLRRFRNNSSRLLLSQYQSGGLAGLQQLGTIVVTYVSALAVIRGTMSIGTMLAVQQLLGQAVVPLALLPSLLQSLQAARLSLERLSEISSQPAEAEGAPAPRNAAAPRISLRDVAFSYGGRRDPLALSGIDLDFRPGTVTAIVGPSGSGKSTLLKLLLAFFRPSRGVILIDGVPLAEVPPASWRARCGVVQQDGYLFNDTLSNNIALGVEVPDQSRVRRAAELANACEFVDAFPQGFATRVGRNGQGLSQGQRQRILIARALYRDPAVLILDEATSALDSANEALITRGLQSCFSNRTVIVMAHRLSTVRNADRIAVLESGCVAEVGNHDELIARRGAYYRLVETQVELGAGRTVA